MIAIIQCRGKTIHVTGVVSLKQWPIQCLISFRTTELAKQARAKLPQNIQAIQVKREIELRINDVQWVHVGVPSQNQIKKNRRLEKRKKIKAENAAREETVETDDLGTGFNHQAIIDGLRRNTLQQAMAQANTFWTRVPI